MKINKTLANQVFNGLLDLIPMLTLLPLDLEASQEELAIYTSFEESRNHHGTAFAGSIYTLAVTTGLVATHAILNKNLDEAAVVIGQAEIKYHKPIIKDYVAKMNFENLEKEEFIKSFTTDFKAHTTLNIEIFEADKLCVEFKGEYFAIKK